MSNTNNYNPAIIAERIKTECARQNIAVKTMLKELNLSHTAIYRMSADGVAPSYIAIARICDYLHISIDTLLDRTTPTTTPTTDNAPPPICIGQAVQLIADYLNISPDYVRGALHLPPDDKSSAP